VTFDGSAGVTSSSDELGSTHLLGVLLLVCTVGDSSDVGAHGLSEDQSEMTKSSNTNDTDVLGGSSCSVLLQRRVDGGTTAKHGCGLGGIERIGDMDGKVGWSPPLVGVTSLGLVSLSVRSSRELGSVGSANTTSAVLLTVCTSAFHHALSAVSRTVFAPLAL
jgi:hypothetical protein